MANTPIGSLPSNEMISTAGGSLKITSFASIVDFVNSNLININSSVYVPTTGISGATTIWSNSAKNNLPYYGTNPMVVQSGVISAGHLVTWNAGGVIQDGGPVPASYTGVVNTVFLNSSQSYTSSAGTKYIKFIGIGGGGAGGGGNTSGAGSSIGAGGGAGASFLYFGLPGTYVVVIGAAGSGSSGNGGNGGVTTLYASNGTTILSQVDGGAGGTSYPSNSGTQNYSVLPGGLGGAPVAGNYTGQGYDGGNAYMFSGLTGYLNTFITGKGADTQFGAGGSQVLVANATTQNGINGVAWGSGGSGAGCNNVTGASSAIGGFGAQGIIIAFEYQ
jgi:hypothetical protein